ncbi:helix-hairpin-helix domain-containing protein [Listeria booriae]|uniref:ComEA family DNA-binding protein n=1 Tax=Listeria booriae TaxID=1552123 RepID=UPI001625B84F|nr:helix-hairpin-helix domain-containing protein [Listeria booriae]MBC2080250.1 helix-hairpin-helix domain-containing protein [Listeria booriae]
MKQWKWFYGLLLASLLFVSLPNLVEDYSGKAYASETVVQESINLNTASLAQLKLLDGVGDVLAQRIIENRPYEKVDDLLKVKGIGDKTLIKIKEQGLAVVEEQKLVVNPFDDDDQILSGRAMPNSDIKIYINNVLSKSLNTDSKGAFAYEIGYVDSNYNKIRVEEWRGSTLIDKAEFDVKSSGTVSYYCDVLKSSHIYTVDQASLLDSADSFRAKLNPRYIGLIKEAKLNVKTNTVSYEKSYITTPDSNGNITFAIQPLYYSTLAGKTVQFMCEPIDARRIGSSIQSLSRGAYGAEKPKADNLKVIYQNNQLIFSGGVSPGVNVRMGIGLRTGVESSELIPLTADFPQYKPITLTKAYKKDNFTEYLGKYNLPIYAFLDRKLTQESVYDVQVQNQDINQPPTSIIAEHQADNGFIMSGNLTVIGIPNSEVKFSLASTDYNVRDYGWLGAALQREYTVKLNKYGVSDYHGIPVDLAFYLQMYNTVGITNIVDGQDGKENRLKLSRKYFIDDFYEDMPIEKFIVYAENKERLIP